jgi:mannose-6-phosphate isomerase-like protein (cupin superfamily)
MPSVATLYAIVRELELSLDGLLRPDDAPAPPPSGDEPTTPGSRGDSPVQRAGARRSLILDTGATWELLAARQEPNIDFLYTTYPPGSASAEADRPSRHGGREYGIVQRGRLGVTVGDQTYELGEGDSIAFDATLPHRVFAIGGQAAEAIWFATDRRSLT